MPLSQAQLNTAKCAIPGCKNCQHEIYFHAQCHPHAPLEANYDKGTGWLVLRCHRCKAMICEVAVAATWERPQ